MLMECDTCPVHLTMQAHVISQQQDAVDASYQRMNVFAGAASGRQLKMEKAHISKICVMDATLTFSNSSLSINEINNN